MNSEALRPCPAPRAANALKHGFCAVKYVPGQTTGLAERIRIELMRIHEPGTDEEIDTIEDLAIAKARLQQVEIAWDNSMSKDATIAQDHFKRQCVAQFKLDLSSWANSPATYLETLGSTYEGAECLVRLWTGIVESLAPGSPGLTFEQAAKAAMAKGSCWEISLMNSAGAWIMSRFVKTALEPAGELREWINQSGGTTARTRAEWYLERTPDRATCRAELAADASLQLERWNQRLNELRPDYETKSEMAAECFMGVLEGDKSQTEKFRLHLRYLSAARNQVERCQKRLDALKKGRKLAEYRAVRKSARMSQEPAPESVCIPEPAVMPELPEQPAALPEPELPPMAEAPPQDTEAPSSTVSEIHPIAKVAEIVTSREVPSVVDPDSSESPKPQLVDTKSRTIPVEDLRDRRIPLGKRIDDLANMLGIRFDDSFETDDSNSTDFESFASPREQLEFEAWRLEMERTIAEQAFEDEG